MDEYKILLESGGREEELATVRDPLIAAAAFRALLLRGDLRASRPLAILERNGRTLYEIPVDGRADAAAAALDLPQAALADVRQALLAAGVDAEALELGRAQLNDVYKGLLREVRDSELAGVLRRVGLPVSNSQILGWRVSPENRKFRPIAMGELYAVAVALGELRNGSA
ncbi:hypothetical protein [Chromobacterium subtsugae]|uniref:hypothetical protein n=1 Tax=Chromobacterium subtsugae TaxID=251747 RepID=UPI00064132A7|nr:hypothetical protein [Chromobacterium subtsugae]OBU84528.1 hypothetical protein MY55_21495 [Chromobacterium subtsugae]